MAYAEAANNRIKGFRLEWEGLGVTLAKLRTRKILSCLADHRRREIDSDHVRAPLCGFACEIAGAAGDIEHLRVAPNRRRLEQRPDDLNRDPAGILIVRIRLGIPTS